MQGRKTNRTKPAPHNRSHICITETKLGLEGAVIRVSGDGDTFQMCREEMHEHSTLKWKKDIESRILAVLELGRQVTPPGGSQPVAGVCGEDGGLGGSGPWS